MNNELAGAVLTADIKAQYDAQCKLVLSQKEVLAWILQGVAEEFALLSREEIKACIEGMPGISSVSVAPGGTGGRITGLETESRIELSGQSTRAWTAGPPVDRRRSTEGLLPRVPASHKGDLLWRKDDFVPAGDGIFGKQL